MKKLFLLALLLAFTSIGLGQGSGPITVKEVDGSPVCNNCRTFVFPNGSLTVSGNKVTVASGGGSSGITIGVTTITSGTTTRVLHNNAGVVGEYTVTGSGNVVLSASPTLTGTVGMAAQTNSGTITQTSASATAFESGPNGGTNPVFRIVNSTASAATGLSITGNAATGGVTLTVLSSGSNERLNLAAKGTSDVRIVGTGTSTTVALGVGSDQIGFWNNSDVQLGLITGSVTRAVVNSEGIRIGSALGFVWSNATVPSGGTVDLTLRRAAAANLAFGATDAAAPVAQTQSVQNVVAGTSNTAGVDWTKKASAGTGTGVGGAHVWQVAPAGSSGTSQNSFVEAMRITGAGVIQYPTTITAGGTTGNQTIDKVSGTVNIAAAGTTVTVTSNKVTANSICFAVLRTNDATAALKNVVPGAGSFTINLTAATTAETSIGFFCINP